MRISNATKNLNFDAAPMADVDKHIPSKIYEKLNGKICKQCGYDGPVRFDTIRHIRNVHLKTKFFTCNKCNFEAKLMGELKKHFDNIHAKHSVAVAFTPAPEVKYKNNKDLQVEKRFRKAQQLIQ